MAEFLTPRSGGGRAINHEGRSIDKQTNPRPGTGQLQDETIAVEVPNQGARLATAQHKSA
jgi:hypothetical protein